MDCDDDAASAGQLDDERGTADNEDVTSLDGEVDVSTANRLDEMEQGTGHSTEPGRSRSQHTGTGCLECN